MNGGLPFLSLHSYKTMLKRQTLTKTISYINQANTNRTQINKRRSMQVLMNHFNLAITAQSPSSFFCSYPARLSPARLQFSGKSMTQQRRNLGVGSRFIVSSSSAVKPAWEDWAPEKGSKTPPLSDVVWPAAGAFAAMALMGKIDQILASKLGVSITIAPFGAVCAVLFATPASPGARKYNMFMAQIGCAAIGVIALTMFGPGWLARSVGLSAAMAFMVYTRSVHPPAASLPLLFIDAAKLHHLNYWFAFFPGAAGCIILCLIQEIVLYLKQNFRF